MPAWRWPDKSALPDYGRGVGASGVNNAGTAVGYVDGLDGDSYAASWQIRNGTVTLRLLSGGQEAYGINDLGQIVGYGSDFVAVYWASSAAAPLTLPPLPGHTRSVARAINKDGVVCGVSWPGPDFGGERAVAWRVTDDGNGAIASLPVELPGPSGGSAAMAVNDNVDGVATIAGYTMEPQHVPVVWQVLSLAEGSLNAGAAIPLDAEGEAYAINKSDSVSGNFLRRMFTTTSAMASSIFSSSFSTVLGSMCSSYPRAFAITNAAVVPFTSASRATRPSQRPPHPTVGFAPLQDDHRLRRTQ